MLTARHAALVEMSHLGACCGVLVLFRLSIINSFVLVLLLTGFLSIILMRVLKTDISRYASAAEDDDVRASFRHPP